MFSLSLANVLVPLLTTVVILEVLSIVAMLFMVWMYVKARRGQREFLLGVHGISDDVDPATYPPDLAAALSHISRPFLMWFYIVATILLCLATLFIILFQPHIL